MNSKELILNHAAEHFAKKGYEGVSLREISRDAGVNSAAVHYHFNGKEDIYKTVITRYLTILNEQRLKNLNEISNELPREERIKLLIRAYITPHFNLCAQPEDQYYVNLLARLVVEKDKKTEVIYKEYLADIKAAYFTQIKNCFADVPERSLSRIFNSMVTLMIFSPFNAVDLNMVEEGPGSSDISELIENVVNITEAAFFALEKRN